MPVFVRTTGQVNLLEPYLSAFPRAQLILDHCGSANPPPQSWAQRMRQLDSVLALARFPNLALKWCKAPTRISMQPYPYADLMPVLRQVMDAFGKERVMWAGDPTQTSAQHPALAAQLASNRKTVALRSSLGGARRHALTLRVSTDSPSSVKSLAKHRRVDGAQTRRSALAIASFR